MKDYEQKLIESRELTTDGDVKVFEEAVNYILMRDDVKDIPKLIRGFTDRTEGHDVMFGLVHAIDYYMGKEEGELEVSILLESMVKMKGDAEDWADILLYRMLNTKETLYNMRKVIKGMEGEGRGYLEYKLRKIEEEDEEDFGKKVRYVMGEIVLM